MMVGIEKVLSEDMNSALLERAHLPAWEPSKLTEESLDLRLVLPQQSDSLNKTPYSAVGIQMKRAMVTVHAPT